MASNGQGHGGGRSVASDVAADLNDGTLYVVWQDPRFTGFQRVEVGFSMSRDGGATWSNPIIVNQTPSNTANGLRQQAFLP